MEHFLFKEFQQNVQNLFPWIGKEEFEMFDKYKDVVQRENEKINLSRLVDNEKIYDHYFLESLMPFGDKDVFNKELTFNILDIGSGSGIPGVLLAIIFKNSNVSVLDSNTKKTNFLNLLIKELNINNVKVINARAEEVAIEYEEKYDIVTSRAVSELYKIIEISVKFCKVGGMLVEPKSQKAKDELKNANSAINKLHLSLVKTNQYQFLEKENYVFFFEKIKKTPEAYPRKWSCILKDKL